MSKIKKPKDIVWQERIIAMVHKDYGLRIGISFFTIKQAKKLHTWLGQAIAYLEQEKK